MVAPDDSSPEPCELVPDCPICGFELTVAPPFTNVKICVCQNCGTSLSIPADAHKKPKKMK